MIYILLRDDEITFKNKSGQVIHRRLIEEPLHHVTYMKIKNGWHVEEFKVLKEPESCVAKFFFAFRKAVKVNEFDFIC